MKIKLSDIEVDSNNDECNPKCSLCNQLLTTTNYVGDLHTLDHCLNSIVNTIDFIAESTLPKEILDK